MYICTRAHRVPCMYMYEKHENMYVHVRNHGENPRWTAPRRLLAMAERCRIPKRSAEAIEAERRASINAERQRLGLSRSEAARMPLPGAEFLMGKRAKSQQTGERAEHFKTEQRSSTMAAARDAAAARHRQLLHGQERLQAAAARKEALIKREAERQAGQRTLAAECLRQEARSLAAVPKELQNMAMAALKVAEKATGIAMGDYRCGGEDIPSCSRSGKDSQRACAAQRWADCWACDGSSMPTKCKGEAISGTGRFEGVSGKMTWIDKSGFGEGQGTFNLKK